MFCSVCEVWAVIANAAAMRDVVQNLADKAFVGVGS